MMLIGLFLWMYSLVLFGRTMESGTPQSPEAYFSLILCSLGVSVCLTVLMRMERTMVQVARFSAGNELGGYHQMRRAGTELATLVGEMIALCALTILSFAAGKNLPAQCAGVCRTLPAAAGDSRHVGRDWRIAGRVPVSAQSALHG